MKLTVLAPLITSDGTNAQTYFSHDPADLWQPIKQKVWSIPAAEVRTTQASDIPLRADHGGAPIGRIHHLERARDGALWAVGELDEDPGLLPDRDYYLSVEASWYDRHTDRDIEITGAALCSKSAMLGLWPAVLFRDGLNIRNGECTARLPEFQRAMLATAETLRYRSRYGEPIVVHDQPSPLRRLGGGAFLGPDGELVPHFSERSSLDDEHEPGRPPGKLRIRPCRILNVS